MEGASSAPLFNAPKSLSARNKTVNIRLENVFPETFVPIAIPQEARMRATQGSRLSDVVSRHEDAILSEWIQHQLSADTLRRDLMKEDVLRSESKRFLGLFRRGLQSNGDPRGHEWQEASDLLSEVSASRARLGFTPSETATFVFSLKQPLFDHLRVELRDDPEVLTEELWRVNVILDRLGLQTAEYYQRAREDVIRRQQQEMLELSTPVVQLWEGILALPLIGTLDSERTQVVMESLLNKIVETGASIAIIDITGVPTVDTLVAQHLLKTVSAARLMGADCIISGIRPQIAQTIVHLGVDLADVTTKSTLADAFAIALRRHRLTVRPETA